VAGSGSKKKTTKRLYQNGRGAEASTNGRPSWLEVEGRGPPVRARKGGEEIHRVNAFVGPNGGTLNTM